MQFNINMDTIDNRSQSIYIISNIYFHIEYDTPLLLDIGSPD